MPSYYHELLLFLFRNRTRTAADWLQQFKVPLPIAAIAGIDAERSALYLDLIRMSLSENAAQAVEATMNSLVYEFQSDFARRYFGEGKAEGRREGRRGARGESARK